MKAIEIGEKIYVIPRNARHLLIIQDQKIRKIEFKEEILLDGAFNSHWHVGDYIFLFPLRYSQLIRFNIKTEKIDYIDGIKQFHVREINGELCVGGISLYGNELVFASPEENLFLFMDIDTLNKRVLSSHATSNLGTQSIVIDGDELWLLPLKGMVVTCWNPITGEAREYGDLPINFKSIRSPYGIVCNERPFGNMAFFRAEGKETIVISPCWGNMYVTLDRESGKMEEWNPPNGHINCTKDGYFASGVLGGFIIALPYADKPACRLWNNPERRLYEINIETKEYREVKIAFDMDDLYEHEPGFMEESEWMPYCLNENAFNSLADLLDGNITGNGFDRERQLNAFERINVNTEGTCGQNIHTFVTKGINRKM